MSKKTYVLDTNVLLHDPLALGQFKEHEVVVPLSVLEELDKLKGRSNAIGRNARDVIDKLNTASLSPYKKMDNISSENDCNFSLFLENPTSFEGFPLILDQASHKVLQAAFILQKNNKDVVFVSKDYVSRAKAETLGLKVQDYEVIRMKKPAYTGLQVVSVEKQKMDLFYKNGVIEDLEGSFNANEFCLLKSEENSSAICKFNAKNKKFEPLVQIKKDLWGIQPLNIEQRCAVDLLLRDDIQLVTMVGEAGTGKTLLALASGMYQVFDEGLYSKILVSRPIVSLGKDIGYLPGTKEEKMLHWMQPVFDNLEVLCEKINGEGNGASTMNWILESKKLEMEAITYIRGRSLPKMFLIIDEAQNLTPHEVKTIVTRAGKGTKVILTGDPTQIDHPHLNLHNNGLSYTISKFKNQRIFGHIVLDKTERSELARLAAKLL